MTKKGNFIRIKTLADSSSFIKLELEMLKLWLIQLITAFPQKAFYENGTMIIWNKLPPNQQAEPINIISPSNTQVVIHRLPFVPQLKNIESIDNHTSNIIHEQQQQQQQNAENLQITDLNHLVPLLETQESNVTIQPIKQIPNQNLNQVILETPQQTAVIKNESSTNII
jgi:hypothetical protein